jgi:hypothetical protein
MTINFPSLSTTSWKSTVQEVLTITMIANAALLAYPPAQSHLKLMAIIGGVQVVAKAIVAVITTDADKLTSAQITQANIAANFAAAKK